MADDASQLSLARDWTRTQGEAGVLSFVLTNRSSSSLSDFQLAFTSLFALIVQDDQLRGAHLVRQFSSYHLLRPPDGLTLRSGAQWSFSAHLDGPLRHYTSAVKGAYLVLEDGRTLSVISSPTSRNGDAGIPRLDLPSATRLPRSGCPVPVVPFPSGVRVDGACKPANAIGFVTGPPEAKIAFRAAKGVAGRLFRSEAPLFTEAHGISCAARHAAGIGPEGYRIDFAPDALTVHASGHAGFFYAFVSLGQILRAVRLD